jgi:effector-binding domain-containing protein
MTTTIEDREAQPTIYVRNTVPVAELMSVQGAALTAMHAFLSERGVAPAGAPYVRYHTFGGGETDVEVGVPVAAAVDGTGPLTPGTLPAGPVARLVHMGAHDTLGDSYGRLSAWVTESDREPAGTGWEVYHWIDLTEAPDPASWPAPADWRTDLVQPVSGPRRG